MGCGCTLHDAMATCTSCSSPGQCPRTSHFYAFRLPQGVAINKDRPCSPPEELGHDDAYVPVTHVGGPNRGPTDSGGLWFYYARGCSDLLWHMGRTMLARNRIHAAVLIEQRAAWHAGQQISEREAVGRVGAFLRRNHPRWGPLGGARRWMEKRVANVSVEAIIAEGARGLYGPCPVGDAFDTTGALRPCDCQRGNESSMGALLRTKRLFALAPLAGDKLLSLHSEPLLRRLPLDTLQLHQQPQVRAP